MASHLYVQVRVASQDFGSLLKNRNGVRTKLRFVKIEVYAFKSIDTGTGHPSGPIVWPGCEFGHLSSQSLTPSPSLSNSAQLGAGGGGGGVGAGGAGGGVGEAAAGPNGITTPTEAKVSPNHFLLEGAATPATG